jgi:hypothetical protein
MTLLLLLRGILDYSLEDRNASSHRAALHGAWIQTLLSILSLHLAVIISVVWRNLKTFTLTLLGELVQCLSVFKPTWQCVSQSRRQQVTESVSPTRSIESSTPALRNGVWSKHAVLLSWLLLNVWQVKTMISSVRWRQRSADRTHTWNYLQWQQSSIFCDRRMFLPSSSHGNRHCYC